MEEVNCGYSAPEPERVVQFKVKPVTRYIITRHTVDSGSISVDCLAELDNRLNANKICEALAEKESQFIGTSSWFSLLDVHGETLDYLEV